MSTALTQLSTRLKVSEEELHSIVMNTVMPGGGRQVTNDQFVSFLAVANEYKLNPLVKEIYAFPAQGGGIQPIVSIDGWLRIINSHKDFNGMTYQDNREGGQLISVTCRIYKKGIEHPVEVTEYMSECYRNTPTWKQYPARMLRHKATIQAGRYAFGISGIIDPDEAERFEDAGAIVKEDRDITPEQYPAEEFKKHLPAWGQLIESGKKTASQIIAMVESKGQLSEEQKILIEEFEAEEAA
uniref:recombinase RecT n=1 Tax=Ningiella ruwaisensis TaxID=2364274 RepID=UPI0010A03520|nr:recombinase RecT [Ningiella ruwaisensis]